DRTLTAAEAAVVSALMARRLTHEPIARIVGAKEFWGLTLKLNGDTLVPRPETETVVEAALAALGNRRREALRLTDLGTLAGRAPLGAALRMPRRPRGRHRCEPAGARLRPRQCTRARPGRPRRLCGLRLWRRARRRVRPGGRQPALCAP